MLVKEVEALVMQQNSSPPFGFKCLKFKDMFSNPEGIAFLAYFSEINKMCSLEPSKQLLLALPQAGTDRFSGKNVMAFSGNKAPESW